MFDPEYESGMYRPVAENDSIWAIPQFQELKGLAAMDGTTPVWGVNDHGHHEVRLVESDEVHLVEELDGE